MLFKSKIIDNVKIKKSFGTGTIECSHSYGILVETNVVARYYAMLNSQIELPDNLVIHYKIAMHYVRYGIISRRYTLCCFASLGKSPVTESTRYTHKVCIGNIDISRYKYCKNINEIVNSIKSFAEALNTFDFFLPRYKQISSFVWKKWREGVKTTVWNQGIENSILEVEWVQD